MSRIESVTGHGDGVGYQRTMNEYNRMKTSIRMSKDALSIGHRRAARARRPHAAPAVVASPGSVGFFGRRMKLGRSKPDHERRTHCS